MGNAFSSEDRLQLYYFDIPGKAEAIRLLLTYLEVPFEDIRMTRDEFNEKKLSGELPFGQVPLLKINGEHTLAQSAAIMRFIGRKSEKVYPADPLVCAKIDAIIDQVTDAFTGVTVSTYGPRFGFELDEDSIGEIREKIASEVLPRHIDFFTTLLKQSHTFWLCGTDTPTIADFVFVTTFEIFCTSKKDIPEYQELIYSVWQIPEFVSIRDKFYALPQIVKYYEDRKAAELAPPPPPASATQGGQEPGHSEGVVLEQPQTAPATTFSAVFE